MNEYIYRRSSPPSAEVNFRSPRRATLPARREPPIPTKNRGGRASYCPLLWRRTLYASALKSLVRARNAQRDRALATLGFPVNGKISRRGREAAVQTGNSLYTCFTSGQGSPFQTTNYSPATTSKIFPTTTSRVPVRDQATSPIPIMRPIFEFPTMLDTRNYLFNHFEVKNGPSLSSSCPSCSCPVEDKHEAEQDYWIPTPKAPVINKDTTDSWMSVPRDEKRLPPKGEF
ncbi:hypothetical protein CRM22_010846 [Opisthorchis felineus]|uniref:Uncharacterized protein n=1 Tax=Opisthorchis felineus TaxID=147828 RepID=A0A4S2KR06_OPIFE|nr:hypothetical protein CRM22_010846 [Opisthorchis felineus]